MGLFHSLRKQWKRRRIARVLGAPLPETIQDRASFTRKRQRALEQLLDLCESDRDISRIMRVNNADRETLRAIYAELSANGADEWEGGHFVPVAALTDDFPLLFLLQHAGKLPPGRICLLLIEYFERNDSGPVPLDVRGSIK